MSLWQEWLRRPQRVFLRRALFQIHLWTGIGVGLYVVLVCVSGSAVVFRAEVIKYITRGPRTVTVSGKRLTDEQLGQIAQREFPQNRVSSIEDSTDPKVAVDIWLDGRKKAMRREYDPYTGKDLGNRESILLPMFSWLVEFHGDLGFGPTGVIVNGIGGFFLALLCITGVVIWWPGIRNWRRSVVFSWRSDWKRFNWELHSAVGIWMLLIVFMFGITGAYLVFELPFERAINVVAPLNLYRFDIADDDAPAPSPAPVQTAQVGAGGSAVAGRRPAPRLSVGDEVVRWSARVHYGRFYGVWVKWLYVVLGLIPPFLFITGTLMWWNRVLRPEARRARRKGRMSLETGRIELQEVESGLGQSASR